MVQRYCRMPPATHWRPPISTGPEWRRRSASRQESRWSVSSGLKNPSGVVVDALNNVFFAESGTGNVYKETVSLTGYGKYAYSRTTLAGGLKQPAGLALDGAGNLYVATPSLVYKETPSRGTYVQSEIVTDLTGLTGIAVDRSGNLYLTSSVVGDVHKETLQTNGSYAETAIGYGIVSPSGVAVDGSGDIFILNTKNDDLFTETQQANGSYLQTTVLTGIFKPGNLTVDGNGNLYIADPTHGEIDKLTLETNGGYVQTVASFGLTEPSGLAVDGAGDLYYSQNISPGELNMIDVFDQPLLAFATTKVGLVSGRPTVPDDCQCRQRCAGLPGSCFAHKSQDRRPLCSGSGIHLPCRRCFERGRQSGCG